MNDFGSFLNMPSPDDSLHYIYGDSEQYYSESQSPANSASDLTSATDISNVPSTYPSPGHDERETPQPTTQQQKPAAKRKRENRYKNAPPAVLSRRRAQNRASQRAYRERKDQRIKDLEQMLDDARKRNDVLSQAYAALHAEYVALKASPLGNHRYSQHHHAQVDLPYGAVPGMGLSGAGEGLDMDLFGYGDMNTGYSL
ncbi:hypothetical protein VTK56DRAFT_1900 [Thermocarpiscus australiensis]